MKRILTGTVATALIAVGMVGAATPAAARDRTGLAIGAGILGLGVGAAIASDRPRYYYAPPPPPPPPPPVVYYDAPPPPPPPPGYYGYGYGGGCRSGWHWSPRWGQYVQDRRCW